MCHVVDTARARYIFLLTITISARDAISITIKRTDIIGGNNEMSPRRMQRNVYFISDMELISYCVSKEAISILSNTAVDTLSTSYSSENGKTPGS